MTNISTNELTVGYCTNVHAGVDLPSIRSNLDEFAVAVRENLVKQSNLAATDDLGVGLWIPDAASQELTLGGNADDFARFLSDRHLAAFTINGFPFDNFHQKVVKHGVYLPTWCQRERLEYTQRLADILAAIMPAKPESSQQAIGSISTLPIGWPNNPQASESGGSERADEKTWQSAGEHFRELADYLAKIEAASGKRIIVAIEPEPGCILDTTDDVIRFFESQLPLESHRRYVTVCHDVCHSAVMMEPQSTVLKSLGKAGVSIGKVQVSSAIVVDWESMANGRRIEALDQLSHFGEDRYLHQTGRRLGNGQFELAEDLPQLIRAVKADQGSNGELLSDKTWVVHFHVPIFLERFGHLSTSHDEVLEVLRTLCSNQTSIDFTGHLEVETYAWTVLPEAMQKRGLADDISAEIQWLQKAIVMAG